MQSAMAHACLEWHVAMTDWWVIILQFQGAFYRPPWTLSKQMFRGSRQVFQVGQAPSGPTVIWPLVRFSFQVSRVHANTASFLSQLFSVLTYRCRLYFSRSRDSGHMLPYSYLFIFLLKLSLKLLTFLLKRHIGCMRWPKKDQDESVCV